MPQPTPTLHLVEVGVAAFAVAAILWLVWMWLRHWLITKDPTVSFAAARMSGTGPWRHGLLQMSSSELAFFPLASLRLGPRYATARSGVEVGTAGAPPAEVTSLVDPVAVTVKGGAQEWELCLPRQVYFSLRSWQESMPPGHSSSRVS